MPLFKDRRRIVRKDPDGFYEKNAAYMVEPESFDGVKVEDVSLMGIVAYNDSTCYVCEYGKTGNNVRSLLVKVICNSETWYGPSIERMSFIDSLRTLHLRTIETLTELARDSSNFNYAVKEELIDLTSLIDGVPVGLTLIGHDKIAILRKQNYGIVDGNIETGNVEIEKEDLIINIIDINY